MATRTLANGGGNYSATGTWVEGAVPTAADDVVATGTSGQLTIDVASACRSADFTNYTGTLTHTAAVTWSIGTSTVNGTTALKLVSGMTYAPANDNCQISFVSTSATQIGITSAGKSLGNLVFNGVGGSWQLLDTLSSRANTTSITLTAGAFSTNGQTVNYGSFVASSNSNVRSLTLGTSTWNIKAVAAITVWNAAPATATNLTMSAASSTLVIQNTSANARTFAGGGFTYGTLTYTVAGSTAALTISGSNTFATLNFSDASNARTLTLTISTTQTVTTLNVNGTAGKLMTINSTAGGTQATIFKASGTVSLAYCNVTDNIGTGGATFNVDSNSTLTNATNWVKLAAPATDSWGRVQI